MDTSTRAPRWVVTGVLGLAVLGAGGCASSPPSVSEQLGPAVVVAGPAESTLSRPPTTKASLQASGGTSAEADPGGAKKVTAPSPQTANSPTTPPSAATP
jgi:hypothetical protein